MSHRYREIRPGESSVRRHETDASAPVGAEPGAETYDGSIQHAVQAVSRITRGVATLKRRIAFGVLVLMAFTLGPFMLLQWLGPRAEPPPEPPIDRLNREHADLWPNAADDYGEFSEFLPELPEGELRDFTTPSREALPAHVVAWIDDREYLVDIIRRAAAAEGYYCRIERDEFGTAQFRPAALVRTIPKYLMLRARVQAERRDLAGFLESLQLADRVGRHVRQQPGQLAQLVAMACRASLQAWCLIPLEWKDVAPDELLQYVRSVALLCEEAPLSLAAWTTQLEIDGWAANAMLDWKVRLFVPRSRIRGELLKRSAPMHELLASPIEEWVNPGNPHRIALLAGAPRFSMIRSAINVPGAVAAVFTDLMASSNLRALDLDVRLIATQRGNRAALAVWEHRLTHGEWPTSLSPVGIDLRPEPYTRQPFIYRVTGDEMTLYAAGIDRDDDGGRHNSRFGEKKAPPVGPAPPPDGDFVFWPIPEPCEDQ